MDMYLKVEACRLLELNVYIDSCSKCKRLHVVERIGIWPVQAALRNV